MRTRTARADELDLFVEAGGAPEHRREIKGYVEDMFAAGSMRPEWCFVLEDGDRAVGHAALWTLPKSEEPLDAVLLDVPWKSEHLGIGERLLADVLEEARALGAEEIGHVLDAPPIWPQFQHHPEERAELLERAGFALKRETVRFEWRGGTVPEASGRLEFRALEDVGEGTFVDAVARVTEGTLDRDMDEEREKQGPREAAREFFGEEQDMDYGPGWWELAYAPDGDLVGLIMPARNPSSPVIDYIGVVPERRGEGYVDDLLARGAATLLDAGTERIRADTDTANAPMAEAFHKGRVRGVRREARVRGGPRPVLPARVHGRGGTLNHDEVRRWLDAYVEAWRTYDPAAIGALFAEDATYAYHPYDEDEEVVRGRDAIVADWLEHRDPPDSWEASYRPLLVEGKRAIATGTTAYADGRFHWNLWDLRFEADGRCAGFVEWYTTRPPR